MSLKTRRFLYIFFIIIFIITTPLICLYSTGYKIGSNFIIKKTGMLILDTEPKGAKIYINGKLQNNFFKKYFTKKNSQITTPAKIKNILPGNYDIKIEYEGYWSWEKKLKINSGQSTFAEDIYLFKKNIPLSIINKKFNNIKISNNKKYLVAINKKENILINLNKNNIINYTTATSSNLIATSSNLIWSSNDKKIIINNVLFNINDWQNPIILKNIIGKNIKTIKWANDSDDKILYKIKNSLHIFNLLSGEDKILFSGKNFSDYIQKNNLLYIASESNLGSNLIILNIDDNKILKNIKLSSSSYSFINKNHKLINLYDNKYKILYLIDPFSDIKPLHETINNIKEAYWINDSYLIYANDFEIWTIDINNYNRKLLTRLSQKINKIIWHYSNNYIIYSTDKEINAIELDNREKHSITKLAEYNSIQNLSLSSDGNILYFYSKIGNQNGVYKLIIQ